MDEIEMTVRDMLASHGDDALRVIDARIAAAARRGGWSDVIKWQRVKLRMRRVEHQAMRLAG